MTDNIKKGKFIIHPDSDVLVYYCPGCKGAHSINGHWQFDGNYDKPTISPSIMSQRKVADFDSVCHCFIKNGMIEYLGDCTHELKGQTVPMEDPDKIFD